MEEKERELHAIRIDNEAVCLAIFAYLQLFILVSFAIYLL